MKKYKDLYEEEKRQHGEALQRYQEDNIDEIEIISLHKSCNKKVSEPKKTPFKSDEPKKVSGSPGLIDDPSGKEQEPKKVSRPCDGEKVATKAGKKIKKTPQPKKASKSPEFSDSRKEVEEEQPKDDKEKKIPPLLGVKKEAQGSKRE